MAAEDLDDLRQELLEAIADVRQVAEAAGGEAREAIEAAAALAGELTAFNARKAKVWSWPHLTYDEAKAAWPELATWITDILMPRYPEAYRVMRPCWYSHPDALDYLSSAYATWKRAYRDPTADPELAAWWLDRWLPALIRQLATMKDCDKTTHKPFVVDDERIRSVVDIRFEKARKDDLVARQAREGTSDSST